MRQFLAFVGSFALPLPLRLVPYVVVLGACGGGAVRPAGAPAASAVPSPAASSAAAADPGGATPSSAPTAAPTTTVAIPMMTPPPPPNPTSTKATTKTDATWATCHQGTVAKTKDVVRDVAAMAAGCAKATKMQLVGKTVTGKQGDQDPPQSFPLQAEAHHCYRVYAQASDGIRNLVLVLKDSTGAVAGHTTGEGSPVAPEDGAVCFKESDAASIVVAVGMGKGAYALQVWRD